MERIRIRGGRSLSGEIYIQGSKNVFHKILAACVRWPGIFTLHNVPAIDDALWHIEQFEYIGGSADRISRNSWKLDSRAINSYSIPLRFTKRTSGSFLFAGALLARFGRVVIASPGGDEIGYRPVNYHLDCFKALGAEVREEHGQYHIQSQNMAGSEYEFPHKSVNGTINAILAGSGSDKAFTIRNVVLDSVIVDSINFMNAIGMNIEVNYKSATITLKTAPIVGIEAEYSLLPDSNVTATYAIIASISGKDVSIRNANIEDTDLLWEFLREAGCDIEIYKRNRKVRIQPRERNHVAELSGAIQPEFSTDWAPVAHVLLTQLPGQCEYTEKLFSNRFDHLPELVKMGADIIIHNKLESVWELTSTFDKRKSYDKCRITGPTKLSGTFVTANDIRNGAALIAGGLVAEGCTIIDNAFHIKRGYENMIKALQAVGADIRWENNIDKP